MMCTQDDYYRTLALTNSEVTFYPNDAASELSLAAPIAFPEGVNTDSIPYTGMPLSFSVRNAGGTFRGEISARIYKGSFSRGQYEIMDSVVIRRNQSLSSALQQVFDENLLLDTQYKMKLCWRADPSDSWHNFEPAEYAELPFKLYDPDPNLVLTDTIRFDRNDSVPRSNATLHYSIKNTGAPFDGELQLSFYQEYFSRGKSEIQTVHIGTNETLTGTFSGPLEQVEGTYQVILRYRMLDGEGYWQEFIDKNGYNLGEVEATIVADPPLQIVYNDAICEGLDYNGYGFEISAAEMPDPNSSKDFVRVNQDKWERDSIITLTLFITRNDTTNHIVSILNTELPYTVDEYYTVPADASVGSFEVVVRVGDEGCKYNRYAVTISQCQDVYNYYDNVCEDQSAYNGFGFLIMAKDMPVAGTSKQYSRVSSDVSGCDSIITFTLSVLPNDTVDQAVAILNTDLPYKVDENYTVPADASVGSFEVVLPNDDECGYNRYIVTIEKKEENPDVPMALDDGWMNGETGNDKTIVDGHLLILHNGHTYNAQGLRIE